MSGLNANSQENDEDEEEDEDDKRETDGGEEGEKEEDVKIAMERVMILSSEPYWQFCSKIAT